MDVERSSLRKREFCARNGISIAYFYKLRSAGKGPRETDFGRITIDAERDWLKQREAAAAQANKPLKGNG
jgi:hypothetical protein